MTSVLAVNGCTLVLHVPLRPVTDRQWTILTTRMLDTHSYELEMEHTARTIARTFHSTATTELESGYEDWDRSALVTFAGSCGEVTVIVVV